MTPAEATQKMARIRELTAELTGLMEEFHTDKSRKAGVYSNVGQAIWRVGDAVRFFFANLPR